MKGDNWKKFLIFHLKIIYYQTKKNSLSLAVRRRCNFPIPLSNNVTVSQVSFPVPDVNICAK